MCGVISKPGDGVKADLEIFASQVEQPPRPGSVESALVRARGSNHHTDAGHPRQQMGGDVQTPTRKVCSTCRRTTTACERGVRVLCGALQAYWGMEYVFRVLCCAVRWRERVVVFDRQGWRFLSLFLSSHP